MKFSEICHVDRAGFDRMPLETLRFYGRQAEREYITMRVNTMLQRVGFKPAERIGIVDALITSALRSVINGI